MSVGGYKWGYPVDDVKAAIVIFHLFNIFINFVSFYRLNIQQKQDQQQQ